MFLSASNLATKTCLSLFKQTYFSRAFSSNPTAIIIGGGPGGCVAALALKKYGINSHIYERNDFSSFNNEFSGNIILHGGSICLKWLNLENKWLLNHNKTNDLIYSDINGKEIYRLNTNTSKYSYLFGFITRHRFNTMLREECEKTEGIKIFDNKKFVSYKQNSENITAYFEDGTNATGKILLGYDGINSTVRQQMIDFDNLNGVNHFTNSDYKISSGLSAWLATGKLSDLNVNNSIWNTEFQLSKNAFSMFAVSPNSNEYTLLYIYPNAYAKNNYSKVNRYWEINKNKEHILEWLKIHQFDSKFMHYTNCCKNVVGLDINVIQMSKRQSWNDGRAVIMGDAAHSVTPFGGQGCNNAIYDSIALANIIRKDNLNEVSLSDINVVNDMFKQLYNVRSPHSDKAIKDSLQITNILLVPGIFQKLRNEVIKFVCNMGFLSRKAVKIAKPQVGFDIIKEIENEQQNEQFIQNLMHQN